MSNRGAKSGELQIIQGRAGRGGGEVLYSKLARHRCRVERNAGSIVVIVNVQTGGNAVPEMDCNREWNSEWEGREKGEGLASSRSACRPLRHSYRMTN